MYINAMFPSMTKQADETLWFLFLYISEAYILVIPHDSEGGARAVETEEEAETAAVPAAATMATTSKRKVLTKLHHIPRM